MPFITVTLDELIARATQRANHARMENQSAPFGGAIQELCEQLGLLGVVPAIYHDQWWQVVTRGSVCHVISGQEGDIETHDVSSESLVLALIKSYQHWKRKWEELNERVWEDPTFIVCAD